MANHKLVLPGHLNHYGFLFGGNLLQWADEYAWIACTLEYPDCNFVTIGMDKVKFLKSVKEGTILEFVVDKIGRGNTTLSYLVNVCRLHSDIEHDLIFSTEITFIRIDEFGKKMRLPQ
jgi:acyl-CoA hydrolase